MIRRTFDVLAVRRWSASSPYGNIDRGKSFTAHVCLWHGGQVTVGLHSEKVLTNSLHQSLGSTQGSLGNPETKCLLFGFREKQSKPSLLVHSC